MANEKTLTATPYVVHIPDAYSEQEKREGASWELGAGHHEFGFEVNGARFPLARLKSGGVFKKLHAAEERGYTPPESQQSPPAADTSALEDRIAALEAAQQSPPAYPGVPNEPQQ